MSDLTPSIQDINPNQLARSATAETVAAICQRLDLMLLDEQMPEPMREEIRACLSDLARSWPEALAAAEPQPDPDEAAWMSGQYLDAPADPGPA